MYRKKNQWIRFASSVESCQNDEKKTQHVLHLDTLEQEQFTYEIVIPRARQTFSSVPDWKARLRDDVERKKRSSDVETNQQNLSYEIRAFNRTFDLILSEDEAFLAPTFVTQHFDSNRTWLTNDIEHCFYKGHVNDHPSSSVSISLCHGLVSPNFFFLILCDAMTWQLKQHD